MNGVGWDLYQKTSTTRAPGGAKKDASSNALSLRRRWKMDLCEAKFWQKKRGNFAVRLVAHV